MSTNINTAYRMLISVDQLVALHNNPASDSELVVADCRFSLMAPEQGRDEYAVGHIPGAFYAHLDHDLSSPVTASSGRHPLPDPAVFTAWLDTLGVDANTQVVAYDHGAGAIAARLWWMLRWLGHDQVAVLDGGYKAWCSAGQPVDTVVPEKQEASSSSSAQIQADDSLWLTSDQLQNNLDQVTVIDARGAARYNGESDPIDKRAGHIPGAINADFAGNLGDDGRFLPPAELRTRFLELDGVSDNNGDYSAVVHSCGSGVTACHNLLAMEMAGLEGSRLYAGSWSEWIADPQRPIATGSKP